MSNFLFLIVLIGVVLCFFLFKISKNRKKSRKSRSDILTWMEMTRDERHAHDEGEKKVSFERKRRLLEQIRKEYAALDARKDKENKGRK